MPNSQAEIVKDAENLTSRLQAGPTQVAKNSFLSVVATFMSDPAGDLQRLRRILDLLEKGSGGHLKRGGGFGDQVRVVLREVSGLLTQKTWQPEQLKSVFGWTARLLLVRQERRSNGSSADGRRPDQLGVEQGRPQHPSRGRPPMPRSFPPTKPLRAPSRKNFDALKALAERPSGRAGEPQKPPWEPRVRAVNLGNADREVPRLLNDYTGDDRLALAKALIERLTRKALRDPKRKDKDWVKMLLAAETSSP